MLRWTIRILIVFVVLILAAAVIVHFVLESRWLNDLILARAGDAIGMNVTADSVSVGWGGETTIRNVAVVLPLTGEVVLDAERIEITHEMIPLLILGRPVNVRSVRVDEPQVFLRRYENGRWNAQDVWARVRVERGPADEERKRISLPKVAIENARIHIAEPNGLTQVVGPVAFLAEPQGRMLWEFDLQMPRTVEVQGRVVSGRDWAHQIGFDVAGIAPLVRQLMGSDLKPIRAAGRWEGQVLQNSLTGTLRLDALAVGPVAAHGTVAVQAGSGEFTLAAKDLVVSEPNIAGRPVRLASGSIRVAGEHVRVEQLAAVSDLLTAQINGNWDLSTQSGEFSGSWEAAADGQADRYSGTYRAAVKSPQFGRKAARASITGGVAAYHGEVAVAASIEGGGSDWRQSQWQLTVPTLRWGREDKEADLSGVAAQVRVAWPEICLADLLVPGVERTDANAVFDPNARRWSVRLAMEDVPHLSPWGFPSLDLRLNAEGDERHALISELRVAEGERIATARGRLSFRERGFQDIRLSADWPAGEIRPDQSQAEQPIGRWHLEGDVFGRVQPLAIGLTGQMTGQNISLGKQTVSRVEIPVRINADAEAVEMTTEPVDMFGGRWQLTGRRDLSTNQTQIAATADALSLESVAGMAGVAIVSSGRAHAEIHVAMQSFNLDSAVATGSWSAQDINIPPLRADRAHGKLRIANGLARFDEILLERDGGRAEAGVELRIDNPQFVFIDLTSRQWPVRLEGNPVLMYADAKAGLRVDVVKRTADGEIRLSGPVLLKEQELARVRLVAYMEEQTLHVQELYAEALGGTVEGRAQIQVNRWIDSSASLRWQGIRPRMLQTWVPQFERFEGAVSGFFEAETSPPSARPPEPMRFALWAEVDDGWFGPAAVDSCRITGHLGETRLLIDGSELRILDGQVKTRVRISTHEDVRYGNLAADFNDLNLDQIVHVANPEAMRHIGYLSGTASLLGSSAVLAKDFSPLQGEARISLTKSDLGNNSIIGSLYSTLNLQFGSQEPNGTGDVTIRLEGPSLRIPSFMYFNRGVEVRGAGQIDNLNRGGESPVTGFAVGSTRVLKGINLPGVRSLDRLLATFQSGAASVSIGGTLAQTEVKVVPLPVVLGPFRNLLWSQLRGR
jgi:hypothetical protein